MRLREASDAEKRARDVLARSEWDPSLSEAEFQAREVALRGHSWARAVMTTWLWLDDAGEVLSSCETFRQPSHVGGAAGFSWAVASVLTEPRLRGKGHAVRMMQALVARLRTEPGAQASVLYSEVGARIYERAGYVLVPGARDLLLPPRAQKPAGVEWLAAPPLPREGAAAPGELRIVPTADELDWQLERERFYTALRGSKAPRTHGARSGEVAASFALVPKANEVAVLWLDGSIDADVVKVLEAAQAVAAEVGAARVRVWESQPLPSLPGAQRASRDDALPMYAPLCDGITGWHPVQRGLWV